jgi:aryl-alcohol dehydrogenase-like predicted oxidoreductase
VLLQDDLTSFYYPLPLCLRIGSLTQFPPTLDFIDLAGAYRGGIAALAAHSYKKPTASAVGFIFGKAEQVVGRAFKNLAERFDIFVADRFRFVVDHTAEILVAHPQLVVEPIFCFPLHLQQRQHIQRYHI